MANPADFFARWSRLKRQAHKPPALANAVPKDAAALTGTPPPELPSVESLTAESDYTVFMRPGVAEATRNAALQRLWRSDPVFANLDGLVEYGEDYAAAFKASAAVRTAYRVAQGMSGDTPPSNAGGPPPPSEKVPATGVSSTADSSSERSAKDGSDMHANCDPGWTDA